MSRITAESTITDVTVYSDRAFVTRSVKLDLKEEVTEILVGGLPSALDEYSFRAGGRGTASVKIAGIELQREFRGVPLDTERRELRDAITAAGDRRLVLENEKNLINDRIAFLKNTAASGHDDLSKTIARRRITVEEGGAIMNFYFDSIADLTRQLETKLIALRLADKELEKLNNRWRQMESPRVLEGKSALIMAEVASPGEFTLEVAYVIFGAGWESAYDIRFNSQTKKIRLEYKAAVTQKTGESWDGVSLKLSTASPGSGANPPELSPVYIDFFVPPVSQPLMAPSPKRAMMKSKVADMEMDEEMDALAPEALIEPEFEEARRESAVLVSPGGPSVTFLAPGKAKIPPDGNPHLVLLAEEDFGAETDYVLVPELSETAYLRAKVINSSELVLLAGNTNIYREEDFVGRGVMKLVNPGAEFKCYLGADERLRAKYDRKKFDDDSAGLTGALRRLGRSAAITINSDLAEEAKVSLKARRPVSLNADLKIKSLKFSEKPAEEKDDGTLLWELVIPPKAEKKLSIEFSAEFPKERTVTGI